MIDLNDMFKLDEINSDEIPISCFYLDSNETDITLRKTYQDNETCVIKSTIFSQGELTRQVNVVADVDIKDRYNHDFENQICVGLRNISLNNKILWIDIKCYDGISFVTVMIKESHPYKIQSIFIPIEHEREFTLNKVYRLFYQFMKENKL